MTADIAEILLDRVFGRPVERIEVTGRDGGPLTIRGVGEEILDQFIPAALRSERRA